MRVKFLLVVACAAVFAGCIGIDKENGDTSSESKTPSLKVAVFAGSGTRSIGALRWIEIASTAKNVIATPVDGESIRAGALDAADVLIMPGGSGYEECRELGEEGRERLKSFIRRGGGYIGTCAGFYLISQPDPSNPKRRNYLGLIPYKDTVDGGNGRAELSFEFNDRAEKLCGIKKGKYKVRYSGGPVPKYSGREVEGTSAEVVATFNCDYNPRSKKRPSKAGHAAAVAAQCGEGRIFAFVNHPEYDVDDHHLIEGAFRYVTRGREVKWRYPQRKRGQLAVGFICDHSLGVETARLAQRLFKEHEFDIVPLNSSLISAGELHRLDAVLVPANTRRGKSKYDLSSAAITRLGNFIKRGGLVISWGNASEMLKDGGLDGAFSASDSENALAELRKGAAKLLSSRGDMLAVPKRVNPVKVAVFAGDGCSMGNIPQIIEFSPEYTLDVVGGGDVANGVLKDYDLLFMPGGYSSVCYNTLGASGRSNLVEFVRGGGKYYGVCGGAFLVSQTKMTPGTLGLKAGDTPFLGLVPFKEDFPRHYRGNAPVYVKLTEAGRKVFPDSRSNRLVAYHGGPAFIPGERVEDSDIEVFAEYNSCAVSTVNPKPTPSMIGKAALLGGRVGKGKVYAQCPHPEFYEYSSDMVRDAFHWLTGVRPTGILPRRVRGAKSVFVKVGYLNGMNAAVNFVLKTLLHDRRFDCRIKNKMDNNALAHSDAVVMCIFDKKSWTAQLRDFADRGGHVIFVADTEKKRRIAEKFDGAIVVDSYDKVIEALSRGDNNP